MIANSMKKRILVEQTSFNLVNCSLFEFGVFSVRGRKKLDEVEEGAGFSMATSGVEVKIGGSC